MKVTTSAGSAVWRLPDIPSSWAGIRATLLRRRWGTVEGGLHGAFPWAPLTPHVGQRPTPGPDTTGGLRPSQLRHPRPLHLYDCASYSLIKYRGTWLWLQRLTHLCIWEEGYLVFIFTIAHVCSVDNIARVPHFQEYEVHSSLLENPSWPVKLWISFVKCLSWNPPYPHE